jgi:hypothetical protein
LNDCAEVRPLVEKLHDLEASSAEKLRAEAHLEKCSTCRSHFEFLLTLSEESRSMTFHEPPESYWQHLPRKVLDRIDSEDARPRGFFALLFTPPVLQWAGLGAALVLVAAVGVSVLREEPRVAPPPPASVSLPAAPPPVAEETAAPERPEAPAAAEAPAQSYAATQSAPLMARDEMAAAEPGPDSQDSELAVDAGVPAESVASLPQQKEEPLAESVREKSAAPLERANHARAAAAPTRLSSVAVDDCEAIRREADSLGATPSGADARYRLALCSLLRHDRDATDELEARAVEDSEAFLALEAEGARAEEIREKLRRIKPD